AFEHSLERTILGFSHLCDPIPYKHAQDQTVTSRGLHGRVLGDANSSHHATTFGERSRNVVTADVALTYARSQSAGHRLRTTQRDERDNWKFSASPPARSWHSSCLWCSRRLQPRTHAATGRPG